MYDDVKDQFSPYNNAFKIIKKKCDDFLRNPNMSKAQELEEIGFCVDYSPADHGEEPKHIDYPLIISDDDLY